MLIIDFMSPIGHKILNKFFLSTSVKSCGRRKFVFFAKRNYQDILPSDNASFFCLPNIFGNGKSDVQGFYSYLEVFIHSLYFVLYYVFSLKFVVNRKIVFLSYNSVSHLPIFVILKLLGAQIYVFEHNSIPKSTGNSFKLFFKRLFFKLSSYCIAHIVFEEFIKKQLELRYNASVFVVNHPCLSDDSVAEANSLLPNRERYWFSPSGSTGQSFIYRISHVSSIMGVKLYVKSSSFISNENHVIVNSRFDDYYKMMCDAEIVFIDCDFDNRVSGVFYEAIAANCTVVLTESEFSFFVSKKFPNVFVSNNENLELIINLALSSDLKKYDVDVHNTKVKNEFLRCIND